MRWIFLLVILAGCQTLQPVSPPDPPKGDKERFISFFLDATFGEAGQLEQAEQFNRWHVPVKLMIDDSALFVENRIIEAMDRISAVTGVPYSRVSYTDRRTVGALRIDGWSKADLLSQNYICSAELWWYVEIGAVDRGVVRLPTDNPSALDQCVWEEISQSFGLSNDVSRYRHLTMFDVERMVERPTDWDWFGLWLTYHPDLKPGMSRDEVEPIVRRIVMQL